MKTKKIPVRTCIGCGQAHNKAQMLRIVRTADGSIEPDPTGKKNGRGTYICRNKECFEAAFRKRKIEKAFSCRVDNSVYEAIKNEISNS